MLFDAPVEVSVDWRTESFTLTDPIAIAPGAFTLLKQADRFVLLPIGAVDVGTPCMSTYGVTAAGKLYFAVDRTLVRYSGNVRPLIVLAQCG